jgi:hypothetical protein
MNTTKNIIVAAALSALSFGHIGAAQASETLKPVQGISFHAGSKDAVAYFLNDSGSCKLVVTAIESGAQPTRFEASIAGGESTRYALADAKSLEFACEAGAQTMKINALETVATKG